MNWLVIAIKWLISLWLNKPNQTAVQAQQLGTAIQVSKDNENALSEVQEARMASDSADRLATSNPDILRQPDPDSRD